MEEFDLEAARTELAKVPVRGQSHGFDTAAAAVRWTFGYAEAALAEISRLREERKWVRVEDGKSYDELGDGDYLVRGYDGRVCRGSWSVDDCDWVTDFNVYPVAYYMPLVTP